MYKSINRQLLYKYKKYLIGKRSDLQVKAIGAYWTGYSWTNQDQEEWESTQTKLNRLNKILL